MGKRLLIGAVAGVLGAVAAGGMAEPLPLSHAGASSATPYAVTAAGNGMKISIGGTSLVGGTSKVSAGSGSPVAAEGVGEVTPGLVSDAKATVSTAGGSQAANRACAQPADPFPAPLGSLLALGLACSAASASESSSGSPAASATGQVATLSLASPAGLAPTQVVPGSALATKLTTVLGTLPPLPAAGLPLSTVLADVAKGLGGSVTSLLEATAGASTSTVAVSGTTVSAVSENAGVRLSLLTGLGAESGPLLTVQVGQANVQSSVDLSSGTVDNADSPAAVTVALDPPVGGAQNVSIAPGASQTFLAGTPLATTVAVGAGSSTGSGGTGGTAAATGVTIDALQGVGAGTSGTGGGIDLHVGAASSSATGSAPVAVPVAASASSATPTPAPPPPVTGATTVHTGEPWAGPLPIALLLLTLLTGLGLVARRRLLPLAHLAGRGRQAPLVSPPAAGPGIRGLLCSPSGPGPGPAATPPTSPIQTPFPGPDPSIHWDD